MPSWRSLRRHASRTWLGAELHLRHTYIMFSCTHFLFRVRIFNVLALFCCGSALFLRRVRAVVSVLLSARTVHLPGPSGGVSHAALLLLLLLLPLCSLLGPVSCGCLNVCPLVVCCAFTCVHVCPPVWRSGGKFRLLFSTFGACPLLLRTLVTDFCSY